MDESYEDYRLRIESAESTFSEIGWIHTDDRPIRLTSCDNCRALVRSEDQLDHYDWHQS